MGKINKKADALELGLMLMILILASSAIFLLFYGFNEYKIDFTKACKKECSKFDYGFYKIENKGVTQSYQCWCLEDNEPKNIGSVDINNGGIGEK